MGDFGFLDRGGVLWGQAVSNSQIKGTVVGSRGLSRSRRAVKLTQTQPARCAPRPPIRRRIPVAESAGRSIQLEVTKQGFADYLQTGITLQVATNPTIGVFLDVGQITDRWKWKEHLHGRDARNGVGTVIDIRRSWTCR